MTLKHLTIDQIDQIQLQRLIDGKAAETRDIEYKRDTYGSADKDHGEFLADISSFANTNGGDIVIGMDEKAGVPTGFSPLHVDADLGARALASGVDLDFDALFAVPLSPPGRGASCWSGSNRPRFDAHESLFAR